MKYSFTWPSHLNLSKAVVASALTTLAMSSPASAESVKHDPIAARGCQAPISIEEARAFVTKYHYEPVGATQSEIRVLGKALKWMERLSSHHTFEIAMADEENGYGFHYRSLKRGRSSNQTWNAININRNGKGDRNYGENVAQIVHEIGHLIGNRGLYEQYRQALRGTRGICVVSGYSDDKANEQFAEVFAAYVTRPKLIKETDSASCRHAWKFFSEVVFDNPGAAEKCIEAQEKVEKRLAESSYVETVRQGGPAPVERRATPAPTPTATPAPTPKPSATPASKPTATPTPAASPKPTATPAPTPTATPAPTPAPAARNRRNARPAAAVAPVATPAPTPAPTPVAMTTPAPTPVATPTATPTPAPSAAAPVSTNAPKKTAKTN